MWAPVLLGLVMGHLLDLAWDGAFGGGVLPPWPRCGVCKLEARGLFLWPVVGSIGSLLTCPRCGAALSWRALALPLGGAGLGAASYARLGPSAGPALLGTLFGALFLALALADLERRLLPNRIIYPGTLLAMAFSWAWPGRGPLEALAGAAFGGVAFGVAYVAMRGGLGAGDVKLAAFLGAVVGFPRVISALLLGMLTGGVVVLLLLLLRAVRRGQYLPYGPFLVLGGVVALFWGDVLPRGLWG